MEWFRVLLNGLVYYLYKIGCLRRLTNTRAADFPSHVRKPIRATLFKKKFSSYHLECSNFNFQHDKYVKSALLGFQENMFKIQILAYNMFTIHVLR